MNNKSQFFLPDGRECYPFPWDSPKDLRPWRDGYERVMVPYSQQELAGARNHKTCHTLVVKRSKIRVVKQRFQPKRGH